MFAYGADLGSRLAEMDMSTFTAHPHAVVVAREYDAFLNVLEECAVTLHVSLLDFANSLEETGDVAEAFLLGNCREVFVHVLIFPFLARSCIYEVLGSCGYTTIVEKFKPDFCMGMLIVGSLLEDSSDLLITILLSLLGIERVFNTSLTFAGECLAQTVFSF